MDAATGARMAGGYGALPRGGPVFVLSEEQQALASAVRDFCVAEIAPLAREDDEKEHFRKDLIHAMGEQLSLIHI